MLLYMRFGGLFTLFRPVLTHSFLMFLITAEFYVNIDTTRPVLSMAYLDHVKFAFDSLKLVSVCGGLGLPRPVNTTRPFLALGVSQFSVIVSFLMQAGSPWIYFIQTLHDIFRFIKFYCILFLEHTLLHITIHSGFESRHPVSVR